MQKNDLALSKYIALDDEKDRIKSGWKMLISFAVLLAIYIFPNLPKILRLMRIVSRSVRVCIAVFVILILAALALHFCRTTKVLQVRMHFNKAQKIWSCILLIIVLPKYLQCFNYQCAR